MCSSYYFILNVNLLTGISLYINQQKMLKRKLVIITNYVHIITIMLFEYGAWFGILLRPLH